MPDTIQYEVEELAELMKKDPHPIVAFYGGEPLLESDIVKDLLYALPAERFVIQTNGYFLRWLGDDVHELDSILLSIDGREQVTDTYRGSGCYRRVMKARDFLEECEYTGEIIARMTASKNTDIYEDVTHLLKHFPYVHWQLDAIWSTTWKFEEFLEWIEYSYKPGLIKLIELWINDAKQRTIHGIVPFLGIMSRILNDGYGLPCEAGCNSVTIATDGTILACPVAIDFAWNVLGDFNQFERVFIGEPCTGCEVYNICGGRCLFTHKERLWGTDGFNAICDVTKFLISELESQVARLSSINDLLHYPPYNNTTEIIP